MTQEFNQKVVLVTGGSTGIGRATALAFAQAGALVIVSDVNDDEAKKTVDQIIHEDHKASFVHCDVSSAKEVENMMQEILRHHGRLDCAYNNAGIEGQMAATADCTEQNWEKVLATNLKGVWLCMKYQIPQMLKQGAGAILTPMLERVAEGGEKEAQEKFSRLEPMGRIGKPQEIADAVLWLCSARSSFVTGHALTVDGGWVAQ